MPQQVQNFIKGEYVPASGKELIDVGLLTHSVIIFYSFG